MDVKNYGLIGIGSNVAFGKGGARIRDTSGVLEARNPADGAFANISALSPTAEEHVATKSYVDRKMGIALAGQMLNDVARNFDDSGVLTPTTGDIIIVAEVGAIWDTLNRLLRYTGSAWEYLWAAGEPDGATMTPPSNITGGTVTFQGDHIYLWDGVSVWINIGPSTATSGFVLSANANLVFNGASAVLKTAMTGRPTKILVNVTTAFDGTNGDAILTVGDDSVVDRIGKATEIDLYTVGTYVIDCYHEYSATDVEFYYTVDTGTPATAGACDIELVYST